MNSNQRVMFLRNESGAPVGCLAINLHRAKGIVEYQMSVLNPVDKFNRALARQIALGRMIEQPLTVSVKPEASMHDISEAIMVNIVNNPNAPTRAVRAARLWLYTTACN